MTIADELAAIGASAPPGAWDDVPPSDSTPASLWADLRKLRAFANAVLGGWPDDICLDGFALQEHAVKHGLLALKDPRPTAPCGEHCNCVEYHGSDPADWAQGVDCYVKTDLLRHNVRGKAPAEGGSHLGE